MIIKIESCWSGNNHYTFRLTMPSGERESITGMKWTRALASEALNLLENVYGYNRRAIRFNAH